MSVVSETERTLRLLFTAFWVVVLAVVVAIVAVGILADPRVPSVFR